MSAVASSSSSVTDDVAGRCDGEPKFAVSSLHVERCFYIWVCGTCLKNPIFLRLGIFVCPFKWVQLRREGPSKVGLPHLPRDFDSSKRPWHLCAPLILLFTECSTVLTALTADSAMGTGIAQS
uniref:(northern house mosquito) hypothetical protein n=1 Tax=Culex pipiens TaxID=7175 RepID=A0A8D8BVM1_CULPI